MSRPPSTGRSDPPADVHDDHSLRRVPPQDKVSWVTVAIQRFGQVSALHQFMLGAALGLGMTFWDAFIAITLGSVMLEVVTILMGVAGMREGVSTSVLARWAGFGNRGSALVGLLVTISLAGWFGVQNGLFARGLSGLVDGPPQWLWALIGGVGVTAIVVFGFRFMAWTAYLTVPAFLLLAGWAIVSQLRDHSVGELVSSPAPGPTMSIAEGTTLVAGAFIMGAVMTPDMTRFNRSVSDVVKQTVISVTLGEYLIGLTGVVLAHVARSADVTVMITSTSGTLGALVLVAAIVKINDWNLYSASLGLVNAVHVLTGRTVTRTHAALILGGAGTVLSAIGILEHFTTFLTWIGVITPPVAGIVIAEYFVVRTWRGQLADSLRRGELPADPPDWLPLSLVCWAVGTAVGAGVSVGIPTINSVVVAFVLYAGLGRLRSGRRSRAAAPEPETVAG
ncbi:purine-cytosine permease family protein [Streptoalloteichus hindustanus]|uniref:Cytosine permease n=1 Tax=Streptoalloteichus hindustanus TaxID=2017 RepID=A0A1M5MRM4_STRHI|nr:cytosine permease [Streptoalloteichus hindustanus]SHG80024.1 cytosine permease [Streptoalloteichus hindustanus]